MICFMSSSQSIDDTVLLHHLWSEVPAQLVWAVLRGALDLSE